MEELACLKEMKDKRILIIGGTGSLGVALLRALIKTQAAHIAVFSRNEHNMVALGQQFSDERIQPMLGDIRDKARLTQACAQTDIVFHLAAVKHVPICEQMPSEAIYTNVTGTQNVVECTAKSGVEKVVFVSTDKAVMPHCVYGCTKLLGEKLILSANAQGTNTRFLVFRSGNLLGSSGSVIPLFRRQIAENRRVGLTDVRMNRFFIPVEQAASLLIQAVVQSTGGEIFLPRMDALSIRDVARYLLEKKGLDASHIHITGIRPGESLDEYIAAPEEQDRIRQISHTLYTLSGHGDEEKPSVERDYRFCSRNAVLSYDDARTFLQSAGI